MEGVVAENDEYYDLEIKEGLGLAMANCVFSLIIVLVSCLLGNS